jgi:hypothetical protein
MLRCLSLALTLGAILSPPAFADFPSGIPDRLQLGIGGMQGTFATGGAFGPSDGRLGVMIVFEDALDLRVHDSFLTTDGFWRFGGRHYIDFGYVNIERHGRKVVDQDLSFGRYTFHVGSTADSWFDSRFAYVDYRYDFLQVDPVRISGSAGLNIERIAAGISATGNITDQNGNVVNGQATSESKYNLPVPMLGLQLDWALSRASVLQTYTRAFWIDLSTIRGGQSDFVLRYHWYFVRNAAAGIGFERISLNLPKYIENNEVQRFAYSIQGLMLYVRGTY